MKLIKLQYLKQFNELKKDNYILYKLADDRLNLLKLIAIEKGILIVETPNKMTTGINIGNFLQQTEKELYLVEV